MKNFIFISPNFPTNYWQFCHELKNNGMNVLGIGDQPYDELMDELKDSLQEYYKVDSLENYDEVYRAVAFFAFKYGKIDWLESNNEYWLEQDARLRTDFNINTGFHLEDMPRIKYKSKMKAYYQKAASPPPATTWWTTSTAAASSSTRWAIRWWSSRTTAWALRIPTSSPRTRSCGISWPTSMWPIPLPPTSWRSLSTPR